MAYWVPEKSNNQNISNHRNFYCDYRDDIQKLPKFGIPGEEQEGDTVSALPCAYGSDCLCLEDSSVWILGKDTNSWIELGGE